MRPHIALITSIDEKNTLSINQDYLAAVFHSGGIGIVLPLTDDERQIKVYASLFDGFLFCGGGDIDPSYYGEERKFNYKNICSLRDSFEYKLFKEIYPSKKPILGICRGEQAVNVFLGGSLHQHIEGHLQNAPRQLPHHSVSIRDGGLLHRILATEHIVTNSFHHQSVAKAGRGLVCDATSTDGCTEAVSATQHPFCLGVQWHPESLYFVDKNASKIFDAFISACKKYE